MNEDLVQIVGNLLLTNGVPMPGGHGALFPALRGPNGHPPSALSPSPAVRAVIVMGMLGMRDAEDENNAIGHFGKAGERWSAKAWIPSARDWYQTHVAPVAGAAAAVPARQWPVLVVRACHQLAVTCPELDPAFRDEVLLAQDWQHVAIERIQGLIQQWGGVLPAALMPVMGEPWEPPAPEWSAVAELLAGESPRSKLAAAMWFMHVFHASVGLKQFELDDADPRAGPRGIWRRRSAFYQALVRVLRYCAACGVQDSDLESVVEALSALPLVTGNQAQGRFGSLVRELRKELPSEFGPYIGGAAPHAELCALRVAGDDPAAVSARQRLRNLYRWAEVAADLLIDYVRARPSRNAAPGFTYYDYTYANSRARQGRLSKTKKREHEFTLENPKADPATRNEAARKLAIDAFRRPMALFFANVDRPKVRTMVHECLPGACRTRWPGDDHLPRPCALCQVDPPGPGG